MVRVGPCLGILESVTGLCPLAVNTSHPQGEPSLDPPRPRIPFIPFSGQSWMSRKPRCLITCVFEAVDNGRRGF